jgi:hypothetical protein
MADSDKLWAAPTSFLSGSRPDQRPRRRKLKPRYYGLLGLVVFTSVMLAIPLCSLLFGLADAFDIKDGPVKVQPNGNAWFVCFMGLFVVTILSFVFLPMTLLAAVLWHRGILRGNELMGFVYHAKYPSHWYRATVVEAVPEPPPADSQASKR